MTRIVIDRPIDPSAVEFRPIFHVEFLFCVEVVDWPFSTWLHIIWTWDDATKLIRTQRRDRQCVGACKIMSTSLFSGGANQVGVLSYRPPQFLFWNQPRRNCRRKTAAPPASKKNATRRRVNRIILASVIGLNALSRRRRTGSNRAVSYTHLTLPTNREV